MKNLILSTALIASMSMSAVSIEPSTLTQSNKIETTFTTEISTFCKLITNGDFEAVNSMIKAGTDVNKKSKGMTPLMYAARYNKAEIVKLLIANGADLKVRSDKGYTALKYAKISKAHDTYKIISEALNAKKKKRK